MRLNNGATEQETKTIAASFVSIEKQDDHPISVKTSNIPTIQTATSSDGEISGDEINR